MMKIAYIHYHLKTGGVTTVLKQQVESLKNDVEALVFTGEPPEGPFPARVIHIAGLGYDRTCPEGATAAGTGEAILDILHRVWPGGCDLMHVHNPLLAKNKNFLKILKFLQQNKNRLFLQIHDFAEDGRPWSYYQDEYVRDCHYGAINSRDYSVLLRSGLKKEGLHKVFNMAQPVKLEAQRAETPAFTLYPIRALRRKNIGEAILLAQVFSDHPPLAITLPPNSPMDIKSYAGWKRFAAEKGLNIRFDAGLSSEYEALVQAAELFITTSITEGFGFSFLEPWLANKYLWGRRLPSVCDDFEKNDIRLEHLYQQLLIPLGWIDAKRLFRKIKNAVDQNSRQYNFTVHTGLLDAHFDRIRAGGSIDFGLLDETFQRTVISRVVGSPRAAGKIRRLNPALDLAAERADRRELIAHNRSAIINRYNESAYRKNLLDIYTRVINIPVQHGIDKQRLLADFFDLEAYSLLKWAEYAE